MARRLPWKPAASKPAPQSPSHSSPRVKPRTESPAPAKPSTPASAARKRQRVAEPLGLLERLRSPSTSPPPEPPQEEFMVPDDDRYRMVEDEFLHTAQRFTTHLHRAEYSRLKALARSHHASTISEMARPVVGSPTVAARLRDGTVRRNARQRRVLTTGASDDVAPWLGTSLQGLMERPRGEARAISSTAAPVHATTRAAAGYPHRSAVSTARPRNAHAPTPAASRNSTTPSRPSETRTRISSPQVVAYDTPRNSAREDRASRVYKLETDTDGDASDDDPFNINRRRLQRQKSQALLRKSSIRDPPSQITPDTIPTFL